MIMIMYISVPSTIIVLVLQEIYKFDYSFRESCSTQYDIIRTDLTHI